MASKKSKKEVKSLLTSKKITKMQMELSSLLREKKGLRDDLENILAEFLKLLPENTEAISDWYSSLPIDSLSDLLDYEGGKKLVFNLQKLNERADLRKEKEEKLNKIEELKSEITINSIDILLEKIKVFEKKLAD
ncbi:MAG: hypothetical protein WC679_14210 [Bacteroidales bacterium]|jgi:hypothetical protein